MTNAGEMKGYLRLQNRQQSRNLNRHFIFIERLWDYNVYDKEAVRNVYKEILADEKYRGKGIWQVAEI